MTRPLDAAQRFVSSLPQELGSRLKPIYAPLMKITMVPVTPDMSTIKGVIFTSVNGVIAVPGPNQNRTPTAYCVGSATSALAKNKGWHVEHIGVDANDLIDRMLQGRVSGSLLHLCGRHTRGSIAERLTSAGVSTQRLVIYDQELQHFPEEVRCSLLQESNVIAPIFSPRSARHFVNQCASLQGLHLVALSDAVAEPLKAMTYSSLSVAAVPTAESLVIAIEKCIDRLSRVESNGVSQ